MGFRSVKNRGDKSPFAVHGVSDVLYPESGEARAIYLARFRGLGFQWRRCRFRIPGVRFGMTGGYVKWKLCRTVDDHW